MSGVMERTLAILERLAAADAVDGLPKGEPPKKPGKIVSAKVAADV